MALNPFPLFAVHDLTASQATRFFGWMMPCLLVFGLIGFGGGHLQAVEDADIERLVELLNPAQVSEDITQSGPFVGTPASDIAAKVKTGTWFSFFVFLPFLVLPQVLLVIIIFKFRANNPKNSKPPATFTHNFRLEVVWTAIPVLALLVVAVPITRLLDYQEKPPLALAQNDAFSVEVIGRQYSWIYQYPEDNIKVESYVIRELPETRHKAKEGGPPLERLSSVQESVVFPKGTPVTLFLTATDVNHAWWVPAFGVKKDCIPDRYNHTWFTPTMAGFFEGTCAELCGADHGIMKISATVLEPEDYRIWVTFKRHEQAAKRVVEAIRANEASESFAAYVASDDSRMRLAALRFWLAYDNAIHSSLWKEAAERRFAGGIDGLDDYLQRLNDRQGLLNDLIANYMLQKRSPAVEGSDV